MATLLKVLNNLADSKSAGGVALRVRTQARVPSDLARPVLGVPVGNRRRCYALLLYGAHENGTDLDGPERRLLGGLAHDAEIAYAQIEGETLRKRINVLENQLAQVSEQR